MIDAGSPNPYAPPSSSLEGSDDREAATAVYHPLFGRAQAVTVILALIVAVEFAAIWQAANTISVMGQVLVGVEVEQATLEAIDSRGEVFAALHIALALAAAIAFCLLMPQANRNARSFGVMRLEFTPGWSAGWFFVPFANWWKPYQAMRELWRASEPAPDPRVDPAQAEVPGLLPTWWFVFVINNLAGQVSFRIGRKVDGAEALRFSNQVDIVSSVVTIVAALLAIAVVRGLARRQDERQRVLAGGDRP